MFLLENTEVDRWDLKKEEEESGIPPLPPVVAV
jgi:hypothetical protein